MNPSPAHRTLLIHWTQRTYQHGSPHEIGAAEDLVGVTLPRSDPHEYGPRLPEGSLGEFKLEIRVDSF